jgi:hypothetical protein
MSKFTRRSIPALLASSTGLAAGFIAAAKADSGLDPIYEKIRLVAEADEVYKRCAAAYNDAEQRCWAAEAKLTKPEHDGVTLRSPEAVDGYLNRLFLRPAIRRAMAKKLSESASPALLDLAAKFESREKDLGEMREHDALRERLHAEVAAYEAAVEKVSLATGYEAATEAQRRALQIRDELAEAVLATMPTTLAGAAALVEFAQREVDVIGDDEPATKALATLASFFSRLA